jgi:hypothetical protein
MVGVEGNFVLGVWWSLKGLMRAERGLILYERVPKAEIADVISSGSGTEVTLTLAVAGRWDR